MKRILTLVALIMGTIGGVCGAGAQSVQTATIDRDGYAFTVDPVACKTNDTCDLKRVEFRKRGYRILPEFPNDVDIYGTEFYASYETATIADLEKYVFVQFIRGCIFTARPEIEGERRVAFNVARRCVNKRMTFRHLGWELDSEDDNPSSTSDRDVPGDTHFYAQWSVKPPKGIPDKQGKLYGEERPTVPRLYITDRPEPSVYVPDRHEARNASLEFRTCLYKTSTLPRKVRDERDIDYGEPVVCWAWDHNFVYDFVKGVFVRLDRVTPLCETPFTEEEKKRDDVLRGISEAPEPKAVEE